MAGGWQLHFYAHYDDPFLRWGQIKSEIEDEDAKHKEALERSFGRHLTTRVPPVLDRRDPIEREEQREFRFILWVPLKLGVLGVSEL
jgi:hypothetical protein